MTGWRPSRCEQVPTGSSDLTPIRTHEDLSRRSIVNIVGLHTERRYTFFKSKRTFWKTCKSLVPEERLTGVVIGGLRQEPMEIPWNKETLRPSASRQLSLDELRPSFFSLKLLSFSEHFSLHLVLRSGFVGRTLIREKFKSSHYPQRTQWLQILF